MSEVLLEDMEQIVSDGNIPWVALRDSKVLITGATGTVGSALVRALWAAGQRYELGIQILAAGRDTSKGKLLAERYGVKFCGGDLRSSFTVSDRVDYIFHCAAVTKSAEMAANPVDVIETSIKGTDSILALAREKSVKSMIYLSSMEVYGITDPSMIWVTEEDLGTIDLKNPRSCYPQSKRMCECMCSCWYAQYGVPVKTARLAQTFGAGTPEDDPRIFAQFARSVIAGKDIILHTEGSSRGNYCYLSDAVRGLLLLLLKGENGEAYNIANPAASVSIREMAELVADKICKGKVSVLVDRPADIEKRGYAPDTTMRLSAEKIEKLGWKPKYGLQEMYQRMIGDWDAKISSETTTGICENPL